MAWTTGCAREHKYTQAHCASGRAIRLFRVKGWAELTLLEQQNAVVMIQENPKQTATFS
jgi:hypothetical protein